MVKQLHKDNDLGKNGPEFFYNETTKHRISHEHRKLKKIYEVIR